MIIDCHCHAGQGDGFTGPWDSDAGLDAYRIRACQAGIERSVLLPAFHSDYGKANQSVARIIARDPRRYFGFAFVHAVRDRGRVRRLVRTAIEQYGFVGIKLHRHDARVAKCAIARGRLRCRCSMT